MTKNNEQLETGTVIAGYRIKSELGRGSMAIVYRAIQVNLERPVALKVLTKEMANNEEFVGRFFNEARAAASLSHPNIVQAYDAGVDNENYYFAMEFVKGETVLDCIKRDKFIPLQQGLNIITDIAKVLAYGWENQRLTHGDIKPENIMINEHGQTKLADFGLAKVIGHDYAGTGVMLTPHYGAPELIRGRKNEPPYSADIYSLGATIYHMFSGTPPFPEKDPQKVMQGHLYNKPIPLSQRNPQIPQQVSDFVAKMLEKEADNRPDSWQEIIENIADLKQNIQISKKRQKSAKKNRSTLLRILSILLILAIITISIKFGKPYLNKKQTPTTKITESQKEWNNLKTKLNIKENPQQALEILKTYQTKFPNNLPKEFADTMKQAKKTSKTKVTPTVKPPENTPPKPKENNDNNNPENNDIDFSKFIETIQSSKIEEILTPSEKDRIASLALAKERLQNTTSTNIGLPIDNPNDLPENNDDNSKNIRQDEYISLIAKTIIASQKNKTVTKTNQLILEAKDWLKKYPNKSREHTNIKFIIEQILPNWNKFLPLLEEKKQRIIGKFLPQEQYLGKAIKDYSTNKITLTILNEYGEVSKTLWLTEWNHNDRIKCLNYLGKIAFVDESKDKNERIILLTYQLLTACFDYWDITLLELADDEREIWQQLKMDFSRSLAEYKALELWMKIKEEYITGQTLSKYEQEKLNSRIVQKLQKLQNGKTAVAYRYRDEIADIEKNTKTVDTTAGEWVIFAQKIMNKKPRIALTTLNATLAHYGNIEFPEKMEIGHLRDKILTILATKAKTKIAKDTPPFLIFTPFMAHNEKNIAIPSYDYYPLLLEENDQYSEIIKTNQSILHGLALLETGAWQKSKELLLSNLNESLTALPDRLQTSTWFARGLLVERFGSALIDKTKIIESMQSIYNRLPTDSKDGTIIAAKILEYELLTHDYKIDVDQLWAKTINLPCSSKDRRYFVLNTLSCFVERDNISQTTQLLSKLTTPGKTLNKLGFTTKDIPYFQYITKTLKGKLQTKKYEQIIKKYGDPYIRLAVSANAYARICPKEASKKLYKQLHHLGVLAGSTYFDLLLMETANLLPKRLLKTNYNIITYSFAKGIKISLLNYCPRINFLCTGLILQTSTKNRANELLQSIQQGNIIAKNEGAICKGWLTTPAEKMALQLRNDPENNFWYNWLKFSLASSNKETESVANALQEMQIQANSQAKKYLVIELKKINL